MSLNLSGQARSASEDALDTAARKINQLQSDLASTARMWAVDELGSAIAHQLNEPLTALLLYLNEIKRRGENPPERADISLTEMAEKALHETERVCAIVQSMGRVAHFPAPSDGTARKSEMPDWSRGKAGAAANSVHSALTPREREVLALITSGASNKEGGYRLGISMRTFEVHRAHIMSKLGAKNAADLVRMALSEANSLAGKPQT